jgi:protein subunit release factor B
MSSADSTSLSDAELLAQCDVETFRAGGPGGQHQNVTDSAVRLRHRPTGLVVTCRAQRSQYLNKVDAVRRLRLKLLKSEEQPAPRVPTRPSETAEARRLSAKKARGATKRLRGVPPPEGE